MHNYAIPTQRGPHIELHCTDYISWIAMNSPHLVKLKKRNIPNKLKKRKLIINTAKTEEYRFQRRNDERKQCKCQGSKLGAEQGLARRKV